MLGSALALKGGEVWKAEVGGSGKYVRHLEQIIQMWGQLMTW